MEDIVMVNQNTVAHKDSDPRWWISASVVIIGGVVVIGVSEGVALILGQPTGAIVASAGLIVIAIRYLQHRLKTIPAVDPPQIGVLEVLEDRHNVLLMPGTPHHLPPCTSLFTLPAAPFVMKFGKSKGEDGEDREAQAVTAQDGSQVFVAVAINGIVNKNSARAVNRFVDQGQQAGIQAKMEPQMATLVEQSVTSAVFGPETWKDAQANPWLVAMHILKQLVGVSDDPNDGKLTSVPNEGGCLTTIMLLCWTIGLKPTDIQKDFAGPNQATKLDYNADWAGLKAELEALRLADNAKYTALMEAVERRKNEVWSFLNNSAHFVSDDYGMIITGVLVHIVPSEDIAQSAEKEAEEEAEREAAQVENTNVADMVDLLIARGFSRDEAVSIVRDQQSEVPAQRIEVKGGGSGSGVQVPIVVIPQPGQSSPPGASSSLGHRRKQS